MKDELDRAYFEIDAALNKYSGADTIDARQAHLRAAMCRVDEARNTRPEPVKRVDVEGLVEEAVMRLNSIMLMSKNENEGIYNMARAAKESLLMTGDKIVKENPKRTPREPKWETYRWKCPNCDGVTYTDKTTCRRCGQVLDWSKFKGIA